jgi:hypothetical protein
MVERAVIQLLSPKSLTNKEDGAFLLSLWSKWLPNLMPEKYGNWEPIDRPFESGKPEIALDAWNSPFLAVRSKPLMEASVWMRSLKQSLHSMLDLSFAAGAVTQEDLLNFLSAASVRFAADFGCLHLLTPREIDRGRASKVAHALDRKKTRFFFEITSKDLQQRIPDLFWTTVFGTPYVELLGKERLLSAPVFEAQALSNGAVILQSTPQLSDVRQNQESFDRVRSEVKAHLGTDLFFNPHDEIGANYRQPEFQFSS